MIYNGVFYYFEIDTLIINNLIILGEKFEDCIPSDQYNGKWLCN